MIKVSTGKGDDFTAECLLDYAYFKDNYKQIAVDLTKQKALEADPRAIQQIVFQGVLEKSKERVLEFYKGTKKIV